MDFPGDSAVKILLAMQRGRRLRFHPWVGKISWRRKWQLTPVLLLGKFHGQRSLRAAAGHVELVCGELDTTEQLSSISTYENYLSQILNSWWQMIVPMGVKCEKEK